MGSTVASGSAASPASRVLQVLPLPEPCVAEHERWCGELLERRAELAASRARVGISRQMVWRQRDAELAVVRIDAPDPAAALDALRSSDDPFDRWYGDRERALHGMHLADVSPSERLTEYQNGTVDEFDMFIASALVVRPGKAELLRRAVQASTEGGGGIERVRRWGLKRLTIWMQSTDRGDVVIYESAGEIPAMVLSMTRDTDPLVARQRQIFDEVFGLDLATTSFPIPESAFSWSDGSAF